jgi:hypothetical protein
MTPTWRLVTRWALAAAFAAAGLAACSTSRSSDAPSSAGDSGAAPTGTDAIGPSGTDAGTTTSTSTTSTSTSTSTTTTTTIPLVTAGAVVLVANAANVPGAAAKLTGELGALGFQMAEPTNAAGLEERLDVSKVYYLAGAESVAGSVARVMGGVLIGAMPTPVSITGGNDQLGAATVVVMLGRDLAGAELPG